MKFKGFKQTPKCKKSRHPLTEKGPVQLAGTARVWPGAECLLTSGHFVLWELLEACYPSLYFWVFTQKKLTAYFFVVWLKWTDIQNDLNVDIFSLQNF